MKHHKSSRILRFASGMWLVMLVAVLSPALSRGEQTAPQLINACSAKIRQSGGITAGFSMTSDGHSVNGTLKTTGTKFALETPGTATWYDGKSMWTYNQSTGETTLVSPTPAELSEANPLLLITSKLSSFTATYAKTHPAGLKTIVLMPKSKGTGMKSIHVTVNPKTLLPVKMVAVPTSGRAITIALNSVKTGQKHADSAFQYPKSKYPKVKVVDLR